MCIFKRVYVRKQVRRTRHAGEAGTWCTPMDPHIWPSKSRTTSSNIHTTFSTHLINGRQVKSIVVYSRRIKINVKTFHFLTNNQLEAGVFHQLVQDKQSFPFCQNWYKWSLLNASTKKLFLLFIKKPDSAASEKYKNIFFLKIRKTSPRVTCAHAG